VKRFWKHVAVEPEGEGWGVRLDSRPVKTPARSALIVPSQALADAIAEEWRSVAEDVDPRAMPLTGLANAAIDRVAPDPAAFAKGLARHAESDLTCYRATGPLELLGVQETAWDALLGWARRRYDVDFLVTQGVAPVAQPRGTIERLSHAVETLDAFHLAGLSPLVTIGGSLVAALALIERAIMPSQAWDAVSIDERWQIEQWGADAEAEAAIENRRRDFFAAARFLELLDL
jgi:chaperone required for assembly of F1-ATPase